MCEKWGEEKGGKTIEKTVRVVRFWDLPGGVEVGGKESVVTATKYI